ncbi:AAEL004737-PA [Aedes aegypti]|uniref:AAEL004737-PA n=1 Tax=Aedes aegypti TaxID=7159 RepID=Q17BY7_AEDAE|nr:AAEL004737-PA [Aedes aegypti]
MIFRSEDSADISATESTNNYIPYESMNIEDFIIPGLTGQETSNIATTHYVPSPVPSGASTPGTAPANNTTMQCSPANCITSPRDSPMVGLPVPSPQHSRPASTNSSIGFQTSSPHQLAMVSPQVSTQHPPSMAYIRSPSVAGGQDSPMMSPVGVQQISYSTAGATTQPQAMIVSQIPSPVNSVTTQMNKRKTPSTKRSPTVLMQPRPDVRPIIEEVHPTLPTTMGLPTRSHGSIPNYPPSKSPSYKIFELNRRLQERHPQNEGTWWDYFVCEFFDDSATLSLTLRQEDGTKHFNIKRVLIPKFFKSFFDGGVVELYFNLRHSREWLQNTSLFVDSEQCAMETIYINPIYTKVISEGKMVLEFVPDEMMRIKTWHYTAYRWQEQIPRTVLSIQAQQPSPGLIQQWSMNITRQGFPATTLNFLRMCCILQPMQHLMTMQKSSGINPQECLKKMLVQNWQGAEEPIIPPIPRVTGRPAPKERKKRKTAAEKSAPANPRKKRTREVASTLPAAADQTDVMVVGEPSMMGGSLGKDDERHITRIENGQPPLESFGHSGGGPTNTTSWMLDDVLASTYPDFGGSL